MTDLRSNKKRKGHPKIINPVDEFCLPVQLPTDVEWVAAFIGAVRKLSNRSTWDYDAAGDYIALAERWAEIAEGIQNRYAAGIGCEAEICEDGSCTEIGAFHPALTYYPNNPITQPDHAGDYVDPVWITGSGYIGAGPGDAMMDVPAWAGQDIPTLLAGGIAPSIELEFSGSGEIDVQFLATIQGGLVWGYPDGNPLLGDLVNLQYTDILSLLGVETLISVFELAIQQDQEAFVLTHSWEFDTEGDHTLTLIFFPAGPEIEPPFLGIGGGLRSVQLCGGATVDEATQMAHTLEIEQDGTLKLLADGVPVSTVDLKVLLDDDYVNVEGDTMTGPLIHDAADGNTYQEWNTEGEAVASLLEDDGILSIVSEVGKKIALRSQDANTSILQVQPERITLRGGAAAAANSGNIRLSGAGSGGPVVGIRTAGQDLIALIGPSSEIIGEWTSLGIARGPGYHGYGRSSTDAWRKQFALESAWVDDTDATRKGALAIDVSGYDGDHEVMRVEYGDSILDLPYLGFFGETPSQRQPISVTSPQAAMDAALAQLSAYGLLDITYGGQPTSVNNLADWQKCNAAHFIAQQLASMIEDFFDNMAVITWDELTTLLIDTYKIPVELTDLTRGAFQAAYADRTGIVADLIDVTAIADQLLTCDFELDCMLDWIDGYLTWQDVTRDLLHIVFEAAWPSAIGFWTALGVNIDSDQCGSYELPCVEAAYDVRWSAAPVSIALGSIVAGEGIHNGFDDPHYRADLDLYFDGCVLDQINVAWHINNYTIGQAMHMYIWTSEPTTGSQDHTIIKSQPGQNGNALELFPNLSQFGTIYRVRIRMESENSNSGNYIQQIYVYPD